MSASDDYADSVCRAAAAHVCLAVGASRTYPSVLDTLSDVTKQYVTTIGLHARNVAETGARTDVSVVDVLAAMKQMGAGGCHWADLNEFAFNDVGPWQQPFHAEVPMLPVRKRKRDHFAVVAPSGSSSSSSSSAAAATAAAAAASSSSSSSSSSAVEYVDDGRPPHIPPWLAPLPPKHTYIKTKSNAVKKTVDGGALRKKRAARKQEIAASLATQTKLEQEAAASKKKAST